MKSYHMISWVMKQSVCFFVFVPPLRQTSHVGIMTSRVRVGDSYSVCQVEALVLLDPCSSRCVILHGPNLNTDSDCIPYRFKEEAWAVFDRATNNQPKIGNNSSPRLKVNPGFPRLVRVITGAIFRIISACIYYLATVLCSPSITTRAELS